METEAPEVKSPQPLVPTPATAWKGKANMVGVDLPLPSGNVARVRQLSPSAFITSGLIPDPLTTIVIKAINGKRGLPPEVAREMAEDPVQTQAALEMFDRVLAYVCVEPIVKMPPKCTVCAEYYNVDTRHADENHAEFHPYQEGARHPEVLYADTVDLTDKMFVFQFCLTGTRDLETFRQGITASMGGLLDGKDAQLQAE